MKKMIVGGLAAAGPLVLLIGAALAAIAIALGVAPTANADWQQDQQFYDRLQAANITVYKPMATIVWYAQTVCTSFDMGYDQADVHRRMLADNATTADPALINRFITAAADTYCPWYSAQAAAVPGVTA